MAYVESTTRTSKKFTVAGSRVRTVLGLEVDDEIVAAEWGFDSDRGAVCLIFHIENVT